MIGNSTFRPSVREVWSAMTLASEGMSRLMSHNTSNSFFSISGSIFTGSTNADLGVELEEAGEWLGLTSTKEVFVEMLRSVDVDTDAPPAMKTSYNSNIHY